MERVRDYGSFIVWFMGLGYLVGWALASAPLAAMPTGLHALGLMALAFMPLRIWGYFRGGDKRAPPPHPSTPVTTVPRPPARRQVKPRSQFGLRGTTKEIPRR